MKRNDDHGFTLIELLLCVVILGILLGIAFPIYSHYRRSAETVAAQVETKQDETKTAFDTMVDPIAAPPVVMPTTVPTVAPSSAPTSVVPSPSVTSAAPTATASPTATKSTPPPPMTLFVDECETIKIIDGCDPPKLYVGNYNKFALVVGQVTATFLSSNDSKCTAASYTVTPTIVSRSIVAGDLSWLGILTTAHLVVTRPSVAIVAGSKCKDTTPEVMYTATIA